MTTTTIPVEKGNGKRTYTQQDFERMIHQGISYTIPTEVLHIIRDIDERIKQRTAVQTKKFENKRFHVPKNGQWKDNKPTEPQTVFKPTTVLPNKTDLTEHVKIIQRIKLNLNKLSLQNYEKLQKEITEDLDILLEEKDSEEMILIITDLLNMMSKTTDPKMSDLQATCFLHWENTFSQHVADMAVFQQVLKKQIEQYCRQLTEFRLVDPDKDGDAFCAYNRFISEHRGKAVFLIHYAKRHPATAYRAELFRIFQEYLVEKIRISVQEDFTTDACKKMFVDEWIEHVVLFMNLGHELWEQQDANYIQVLVNLSQTDVKKHPNMTVRSKFKLQGVLALVKK